jgi:hypothetical protein
VTPESDEPNAAQSATVTFEKETAAKTALLLDNTQLGPAQVSVSSAASLDQLAGSKGTTSEEHSGDNVAQEDKPRARIVAEYLAHGYVISDGAIQRAIALDQQHGISNRFMSALTNFDSKLKVSERSAQVDQRYGVSNRAQQGWLGLSSYFEKAANTPTGQKLRAFYESGSKQVMDVHNEAKHLAALKTGKSEGDVMNPNQTPSADAAAAVSGEKPTPEQAEMEKVTVDGQEKTKCNCGGADGKCPCEPGKCACAGCSKAS